MDIMKRLCVICFLIIATAFSIEAQTQSEKRRQYLADILRINTPQVFKGNTRRVTARDSTWRDWLQRTGELPPDFSSMRSIPFLPDPLVLEKNGKEYPVKTKKDWQDKRAWIKAQYAHWVSGVAPPAPGNLQARSCEWFGPWWATRRRLNASLTIQSLH